MRQRRALHVGDFLAVSICMAAAVWFFAPTSMFIKEVSFSVNEGVVRFVREVPFGKVTARWRSEITLIDGGGFECTSGAWVVSEYQRQPDNTVKYRIGDWAKECLEKGSPFYVQTTRQVLLGGWLPLRPSRYVSEIQGMNDETRELADEM